MNTSNCYKLKPFLQRQRTLFTVSDGLPDGRITCLTLCGGTAYVGTPKGLVTIAAGKITPAPISGKMPEITMLFCDRMGDVYVGAGDTVYTLRDGKQVFSQQLLCSPVEMAYDGEGTLWLLARNALYKKDGDSFSLYASNIDDGNCLCFAAFGNGRIYIANPLSIRALHGKRPRFAGILTYNSDKPTDNVNTITADKWGHLWIGTDEGVCLYDAKNCWMTWKDIKTLPAGDIRKLVIGEDGTRYIGTANGLIIQGGVCESFLSSKRWLPCDEVTSIAASSDGGTVFVGTANGVSLIETKLTTLEQKAAHYQDFTEKHNVREGFVCVRELEREGDLDSGYVCISDNDGLWTGHYAAAQSFRYAVTHDERSRGLARRSIDAMLRLCSITGIDGFTARAIRRPGECGYGDGDAEWHYATDGLGELEWKCETSSDEMMGHFYAYSCYFDLCADDSEKLRVSNACKKIADHILSHDYKLCDYDGLPTTWANWNPDDLNYNDRLFFERGINSLELLSMLRTTYHMTGDEKYFDEYKKLVTNHRYALNCIQHKFEDAHTNHIDDHLAFLAVMPLLRYETDAQLRQYYLLGLRHHWQTQRVERCALWNFMYGALTGEHCDIDNAISSLQKYPLDLVCWKITNSSRPGLEWDSGQELFGEGRQLKEPLPADENPLSHYDGNPFVPDGGNGLRAFDGSYFLHAYWLGRYFGLFDE